MISLKELKYVDQWANKIPMPGIEYSVDVLENIKKCYELYNKIYKDKEYSIIFSNSEEIGFKILPKNLCHMMGIDYNNIRKDCFDSYREKALKTKSNDFSSYDLLELIIENMEEVAKMDNSSSNPYKMINYYKSAIKCAIFNKLSDFTEFNFAAVNYIGEKEDIDYENSKLLFVPSNEAVAPYFFVGIKKSEKEEDDYKYLVYSLFAPENPKQFFNNQEVVIPTQILVSNNDRLTKLVATPEEKIRLLTIYESIINKYNIPNNINIFGDYGSMLNDLSNSNVMVKSKK